MAQYVSGIASGLAALLLVAGCGGVVVKSEDPNEDGAGGDRKASDSSAGGSRSTGSGGESGKLTVATPGCEDLAAHELFDGSCVPHEEGVVSCTLAALEGGLPIGTVECGILCGCNHCTQVMLDCDLDPQGYCLTLLACIERTSCSGFGCYAADTCQDVMDAAPDGGLSSLSVAFATEVSTCLADSPCVTCGDHLH